jgi:hypothetical protein
MDVLEHDDRRTPRLDLLHQGRKAAGRLLSVLNHLPERPAALRRDIDERSQRPRRTQTVARTPQDALPRIALFAEAPDECRLADPGLTRQEHQPAAPCGRISQPLVELLDERVSLEQAEPSIYDSGPFGESHQTTIVLQDTRTIKLGRQDRRRLAAI